MPYVKPALAGVVVDGVPEIEELRWKTVDTTHSVPGRFVKRDTTDSEIQLQISGGAGTVGIVLINPTKDSSVAAVAGEWGRVAHGPGVVVTARYSATGASYPTKGDPLYVGDNGTVYKGSTDVTKIVAWAEETLTAGNVVHLVRLAK
jgi:hypothetical protein